MLTVSFWNVRGRAVPALVAGLAADCNTDILILAECPSSTAILLALNSGSSGSVFTQCPGPPGRLMLLSRLPVNAVIPLADLGDLSARHVVPPAGPSLLLIAVHLPSKLHQSDADQEQSAVWVAEEISRLESQVAHSRTLVVGDFNMNPFEPGLTGAATFHAVNARRIAGRGSRMVRGHDRSFFYNPTWRLLSDHGREHAGTYYYSHSGAVNLFWHAFDQVLLRPSLLPHFPDDGLKVIPSIGGCSLLTANGLPDRTNASDHLPITVSLNL